MYSLLFIFKLNQVWILFNSNTFIWPEINTLSVNKFHLWCKNRRKIF